MGKLAYQRTLDLRIKELMRRIILLKARWERTDGVEKFRIFREIERQERRERMLRHRLVELEPQGNGVWQDIKADVRAVLDDLPDAIERWIELLDAGYESHSSGARDKPTAAAGLNRSASLRPKL
jgi:hypothetical protein